MPGRSGVWGRPAVWAAALGLLLAGMCWLGAADAGAYAGIDSFTVGVSSTQAGGHPNVDIEARFDNRYFLNQEVQEKVPPGCGCQDVRDLVVHMPTGFIGDPHAIPQCSLSDFALQQCSPDTQVGVVFIEAGYKGEERAEYGEEIGEPLGLVSPIYNLQPHPGEAGAIGSIAPLIQLPIETQLSARTGGDYGLDATTLGLFHIIAIPRLSLYLWGNPADPSHDASRFPLPHGAGQNACGGTINDQTEDPEDPKKPFAFGCHPLTPSSAANIPYLENPTTCAVPLSAGLDLSYYDNTFVHGDAPWPATTGCDQLKFSPSLTAQPTTTQADTAGGMNIDLRVPQTQSPSVPSPSELRGVKITFPKGFSLTPNGADGKTACTDAELKFETEEAAECPEFSKVGTLTLDSSALPGPIEGAMYIGEPLPGRTFRIFMTADGFATHVKLRGDVHLDPETGQIVTEFANLPQSPFQDFNMHFFGSERGIFATPTRCGNYRVETEFTPWADALPKQTSLASFDIDSGPNGSPCPGATRPFSPSFQAGTPDNTAGVTTPLTLQLQRSDGDQNLAGLAVQLPEGLIQSIKGVTECPASAIEALAQPSHTGLLESQSPACPASSRVGTVVTGAGAGTRILYNRGKAYLAGPYKGAPLSLIVVVPALGGPYDLGNVVVRAGIYVNPVTAQVRAVSDPIPLIREGVPLRARSLLLEFDRPGFNFTPTNCGPKAIEATIDGSEGGVVTPSAYYQVANCGDLRYAPKLTLNLGGGVRRRGHPAIDALFQAGSGESNTSAVAVTLPKGELLDNSHIGTICTRPDFEREACPAGSLVGEADATSPLLGETLRGPVYLRASDHKLPDLAVALKGKIDIDLSGRIDSVSSRLRTTFENVPDVPVSSFALHLLGGSKGLLQNSESLCGADKSAMVRMTGQNGAVVDSKAKLNVACGSKPRHKRHSASRGGR